VNNNLAEYHVPTNADVGEIDVAWVEEDDQHVSPMGAKGIGEIGSPALLPLSLMPFITRREANSRSAHHAR